MKRHSPLANDASKYTENRKKIKPNLFDGFVIKILSTGFGKTRYKLLTSQIKSNGGKTVEIVNSVTTHLIVDDSIDWDKLCVIMKWEECIFSDLKIVKSSWMSQCLKKQRIISIKEFELQSKLKSVSTVPTMAQDVTTDSDINHELKPEETKLELDIIGTLNKELDSTGCYLGKDEECLSTDIPNSSSSSFRFKSHESGKWACSYPSTLKAINHNKNITDKLELMLETYKNTKDNWRAYSYQKAINSLKSLSKEITSLEEARSLPGVGASLADKIWEICESGSLRKLEATLSDEQVQAVNLFAQVWGVGPTTAQAWVQQGFRTLDDLKNKAQMTRQQEIGLKHFHDLLEKMPWDEASQIVQQVKKVAHGFNTDLLVIGCGSFRRGKPLCGDVDILISHPDGKSQAGVLDLIVKHLTKSGFLTDDLINPEPSGAHQTYMGVCCLPGEDQKHRRLDLFVVPNAEFGPALLAYTGSGHFNRSMRLLARKKGMALSHKALRAGVVRKGAEKIYDGYSLPTPTEESVFELLGLEFRRPEERDH